MKTEVQFFQQYINGEWYAPSNGKYAEILNPENNEVVGVIADGEIGDAMNAIWAAENAQFSWRKYPIHHRKSILQVLLKEIKNNRKEIASIIKNEQGKLYNVALLEVDICCLYMEHALNNGDVSDKKHRGIEVIFTDWDFPFALVGRTLTSALLSGNVVILHPTFTTPLSSFILGDLSKKANIPAGVFNILNGSSDTIKMELAKHPLVSKVGLVKSTPMERAIFRSGSDLQYEKHTNPIQKLYPENHKFLEALKNESLAEKAG